LLQQAAFTGEHEQQSLYISSSVATIPSVKNALQLMHTKEGERESGVALHGKIQGSKALHHGVGIE
jgi:hypothetical protein